MSWWSKLWNKVKVWGKKVTEWWSRQWTKIKKWWKENWKTVVIIVVTVLIVVIIVVVIVVGVYYLLPYFTKATVATKTFVTTSTTGSKKIKNLPALSEKVLNLPVKICEEISNISVQIPDLSSSLSVLEKVNFSAGSTTETLTANVSRQSNIIDRVNTIKEPVKEQLITVNKSHKLLPENSKEYTKRFGNGDNQSVRNISKSKVKIPGQPTRLEGYKPPKNWNGKLVKNPNGFGKGYPDKYGNIWVPTGEGTGIHAPHWDVQFPKPDSSGRTYKNVYPGGNVRY